MSSAKRILSALGRTAHRLEPLQEVLELHGGERVDPADPAIRAEAHPYLLALARSERGQLLGLLLWPTAPRAMALPMVRQGSCGLHLEAASVEAYLHATLATLDHQRHPAISRLCDTVNDEGPLYEVGDLAAAGLPLNAYILLRTGGTPEFFESLASAHLQRGDVDAALVTADRSIRSAPGWARPHAFRADVLHQVSRADEAAEAARMALLEPLWTLGARFEPVAEMAGWGDPRDHSAFQRLAQDTSKLPLDRAAHILDAATAANTPWQNTRAELEPLLLAGELAALAAWVVDDDFPCRSDDAGVET